MKTLAAMEFSNLSWVPQLDSDRNSNHILEGWLQVYCNHYAFCRIPLLMELHLGKVSKLDSELAVEKNKEGKEKGITLQEGVWGSWMASLRDNILSKDPKEVKETMPVPGGTRIFSLDNKITGSGKAVNQECLKK